MLSNLPGSRLFGATFVLWVLFAFTILLGQASAAPSRHVRDGLVRRAGKPGIGVELEVKNINIVGPGKPLVGEKRGAIKGAVMTPVGFAGAPKLNWALTAEVGDSNVLPEAIVDGLKNKVGDLRRKLLESKSTNFLYKGWAPCSATGCKVNIKGFDNLGEWTVKWPTQPVNINGLAFGPQVTTAMPLGAVLKTLSDAKAKNTARNPLASSGAIDAARSKILTKKDFASFTKISSSDIDDEFLDPKKGPKHLLPVMPRTDFVAQYDKFIEKKLRKQFLDKTTSLLDVVVKGSGNAQLAKEAFKWNVGTTTKVTENWAGKANNLATGKLEIDDFIDHIQGFDGKTNKAVPKLDLLKLMDKAMRQGQIGSLNGRMEPVLDSIKEAPIFEFRELDPGFGPNLGATLGAYEAKVMAYHREFRKRSIDVQEDADTSQEG